MTDPAAPSATPAPPKKPGLIRWWGFIALAVFLLVLVVAGPWWVGRMIEGKIADQLAARGWELDPEHPLTVSVWGARLGGEQLALRMISTKEVLMRADRLNAELALSESFHTRDLVIAELAAEGVTGSLRRGPDGRIPAVPEDKPADGSKAPSIDWQKVDWKTYYQKGMEKLKEYQAQRKAEAEKAKDPAAKPVRPAPEQDIDWPQAVKHQPLATEGRHTPRVVIRKLAITGGKVPMPDQSPLDIASFRLKGTDIAARQAPGETMTLDAEVTTEGAGPVTFTLTRREDDTGQLSLKAASVPLAALAHPAIAGDSLAPYGPSGTAAIETTQTWTGWLLSGDLTAQVTNLTLAPAPGAPSSAKQAAQVVAALKGRPIRWPVKIGGTLDRPEITDSGLKTVLEENKEAVIDAAKDQAKDKALEKGSELIDKELKKHPEAEKAKGAAKDALKNLLGR